MKIIGLAGGSGSGKTTVCELFSKIGYACINTDEIYHALISKPSPCLLELVTEFGEEILNPDGSLNRRRLGSIVFESDSDEKLKKLNKIAHFHILKEAEDIIAKLPEETFFGVLVDAPLLFESGFDRKCDVVISVIADEKTRIERITARDGISPENAKLRIKKQLSNEVLREKSDYTIVNDGDIDALTKSVNLLSEKIKNS